MSARHHAPRNRGFDDGRFGLKGDLRASSGTVSSNVRFTPKADID